MRIRTSLTVVAAAAAALALGAVVPAAAAVQPHAAAVLTAGGTALAPGATVDGVIAAGTTATFYSSSTGTSGVSCTQSQFSATVLTNPASGTATESLDAQTFGGCTSNVSGVTGVKSIVINNLPFNASVSDTSGLPVTVTPASGSIQTTVTLNTLLGTTTCVYTGPSLNGNADNAANSITFTHQHFTKSTGSSLCFSDAYFSVTYAPITSGGVAVQVN